MPSESHADITPERSTPHLGIQNNPPQECFKSAESQRLLDPKKHATQSWLCSQYQSLLGTIKIVFSARPITKNNVVEEAKSTTRSLVEGKVLQADVAEAFSVEVTQHQPHTTAKAIRFQAIQQCLSKRAQQPLRPFYRRIFGFQKDVNLNEKSPTKARKKLKAKTRFWLVIIPISCLLVSLPIVLEIRSIDSEFKSYAGKDIRNLSQEELNAEKLRQEVLKSYADNHRFNLAAYTTSLAVIGTVLTVWKALYDTQQEREAERRERRQERRARRVEQQRELREKINNSIQYLGSDSPHLKTIGIVEFLNCIEIAHSSEPSMRDELFGLLLASLKFEYPSGINQMVTKAFEKALRERLAEGEKNQEMIDLGLSDTFLSYVNFSGLDLSQTWLRKTALAMPSQLNISRANLSYSNLSECRLQRVVGDDVILSNSTVTRANFNQGKLTNAYFENAVCHETRFVSAILRSAHFEGAQLQKAHLQSAILDEADLRRVNFEQSNLNGASFLGAKFDKQTLISITKSYNWKRDVDEETVVFTAFFDDDIEDELLELAYD